MHRILRVVIDTNHIISAILSARGASAKIIDWMSRDEDYFQLLLSEPIWQEYTTVAEWLVPPSRHSEKDRVMQTLRFQAEWIEPDLRLDVCTDNSDNRFLECAVAGNADFLVTKNIRHFPYKIYGDVKIVRIKKFLDTLEALLKKNDAANNVENGE
jgi:putative PIN family toxin of toxin-antitoxin system